VSMALAQRKVEQAVNEGAEYIVSTDQSCLLHLQTYIDKHKINIKTIHIVDLLSQVEENIFENE
ncbi:MAG: hypothetical protein KA273_05655, partial [Bacteroidales bacterium]|nr:hypothetical protein [Bacteroidales bacterium]